MNRKDVADSISRREFCAGAAAALVGMATPTFLFGKSGKTGQTARLNVAEIDRARVLRAAERYLNESPVTITASSSPRSTGGKHDYFSEGDYWWPDPKNPDGPYIQRDGMSNPDNFNDHRLALIRLSVHVPALTAAWLLTKDDRFATHAARHLKAWFIDESTAMNPHLKYAQAIKGRTPGRGTGIIDTLHLVEVARSITILRDSRALTAAEHDRTKQWFVEYLRWMTTSRNGKDERDAANNHGTCWVVQVSEFADYTGDQQLTAFCKDSFKSVLAPNQIAQDGSFPQELRRTKPYSYSLFNLDAMAAVCQILSTPDDNLWTFQLADGRGMGKAMEFMFPFIADKKKWPKPPDVQYFDDFPVRQPSLLFAGLALARPEYLSLWRTLNPDPSVPEVIRNYPIRQPVLWVKQ
jgi:alginate lyase